MSAAASTIGRKVLAVAILVVAAYLLFELAMGLVTSLAWFLVALVAVVAVIWAVRTL